MYKISRYCGSILASKIVSQQIRNDNILDLVLTTHLHSIDVNVLEYISDHKMVHCVFTTPVQRRDILKKQIFNYTRADLQKMSNMLSEFSFDFFNLLNCRSVNESWVSFRNKMIEVKEMCIPKINILPCASNPWFTTTV